MMDNKKHGYPREAQRRASVEPEHLQKTAARIYSSDTPEQEFPHRTHDLSDLSQHFLNATAFASEVSMGKPSLLGLHGNSPDLDIAQAYARISTMIPPRNSSVLNSDHENHMSMDYNRYGIICEVDDAYLFMSPERGADENEVHSPFAWISKSKVAKTVYMEWESIPRARVGEHCTVATGSIEVWWHAHSCTIMFFRRALEQHLVARFDPELSKEKTMRGIHIVATFWARMMYGNLEKQEREEAEAAKSAMKEFTTLEDEEDEEDEEDVQF